MENKVGKSMGSFKDFYDILKDLISLARKVKNQEVISLAMDLQEKFFELREDNDELNNQIKELNQKIEDLEKANILENDIEYTDRGFFTIKNENPKIPYCSMCWKRDHKLIPLSQRSAWFQYTCGNCKTNIVVMNENGGALNPKKK